MTRERLEALCRLLIGSGDMTPMAERMLLAAHDEETHELQHAFTIVSEPPMPQWEADMIHRPVMDAGMFREGTIARDARGVEWVSYFDTQDRQLEWKRRPVVGTGTYSKNLRVDTSTGTEEP